MRIPDRGRQQPAGLKPDSALVPPLLTMNLCRIMAGSLGTALIIGETARSWGQGRNLFFVIDDYLIAVPLVATAILMSKPTVARRCAFSASFAAAAGMLFGSFFGKVVFPEADHSSNINNTLLAALIGIALATAVSGLVLSLHLARQSTSAAS